MKTIIVSFEGTPSPGDFLVLHYTTSRGGHSLAGHKVQSGETKEQVLQGLAAMCMHLMSSSVAMRGALEISAKPDKVIIRLNNELNDSTWWFTLDEVGKGSPGDVKASFEEI